MKDMLASLGKDPSTFEAADVMKLPQKQRNAVYSCLNTTLKAHFPNRFDDYAKMEWEKKREWLAAFVVDPASGGSVVINTTSREIENTRKGAENWLTQTQLEGPGYLNSKELAAIAIESCESRPHDTSEALRKAGVLEYKWTVNSREVRQSLKRKVAVETTAQLEAGDVGGVNATLEDFMAVSPKEENKRASASGRPRGKGTGHPNGEQPKPPSLPKELSAEEKALVEAQEELDAKLKSTKLFYDKIKRELATVKVVEETLKRKSWLSDGLAFLQAAVETQQASAEALFELWARLKSTSLADVAAKTDATTQLIVLKEKTEKAYDKFKKEVLADFLKLK